MPSGGNATAVDGVVFVFLLKFGAAVFLLIVGFGSAIAPLYLGQCFGPRALSAGNCVAAGVLLAAALVHQLADAAEGLAAACSGGEPTPPDLLAGYPWAFSLCGCSFCALA